eukprot:m.32700 g.32700  ORF g.32700 m.32700 type:complete len:68 (-) comp14144_c0_seq7:1357-1560(-)
MVLVQNIKTINTMHQTTLQSLLHTLLPTKSARTAGVTDSKSHLVPPDCLLLKTSAVILFGAASGSSS